MNFAVIKTGGKQYKVAANDVVKIEKLDAQPGDVVTFDQVLMVGNGDDVTVGAPLVAGATVAGHLVHNKKQRTVIIQKKHRRQHFDRRNGHRQLLSTVRIGEILIGGAKTTLVVDDKAKARAAALMASTRPGRRSPRPPSRRPRRRRPRRRPPRPPKRRKRLATKPRRLRPRPLPRRLRPRRPRPRRAEGDKPAAKKSAGQEGRAQGRQGIRS